MTLASTLASLSINKAFNTGKFKPAPISEASEEMFQQYVQAQEAFLQYRYTEVPDMANLPGNKEYAKVMVNGEVIVTLDNNGCLETSNAIFHTLPILPDEVNGSNGPALAQMRAELIAKKLGGIIVKAETALTQEEFEMLGNPHVFINYHAMRNDKMYAHLLKVKEERMSFLAQQLGQAQANASANASAATA